METATKTGLDRKAQDGEFRREFAHEWLIERFLEAIDHEMQRSGVSKTELARRLDCPLSQVSRTMTGTKTVTTRTMANMALALDMLVDPKLDAVPWGRFAQSEEVGSCQVIQLNCQRSLLGPLALDRVAVDDEDFVVSPVMAAGG